MTCLSARLTNKAHAPRSLWAHVRDRLRSARPARARPDAGGSHQLVQGVDARPAALDRRADRARIVERGDDGAGHVFDPDRLEARVRASQRHDRKDRLQGCEEIEKTVPLAEHDRGAQDREIEPCRLERFFASRGVQEFSLDVAMSWVDQACGGFFDKEQAGTLKSTDVYLFRVAAILAAFAVHGAVLRR